jgi:hypothetical protein
MPTLLGEHLTWRAQWFWQSVENMGAEDRARLLQFITGSSQVRNDREASSAAYVHICTVCTCACCIQTQVARLIAGSHMMTCCANTVGSSWRLQNAGAQDQHQVQPRTAYAHAREPHVLQYTGVAALPLI